MYHVRYKEGGGVYTGIFYFFFSHRVCQGGLSFICLEPGASSDGWVEATPVTDERRLALGPMRHLRAVHEWMIISKEHGNFHNVTLANFCAHAQSHHYIVS